MEETQIYVYNTRTKPWCCSSTMTNRQRYFLQLCSIHGWIVKSALYTWKMRNEKPLTPRQTKWNGLRVWCVCFFRRLLSSRCFTKMRLFFHICWQCWWHKFDSLSFMDEIKVRKKVTSSVENLITDSFLSTSLIPHYIMWVCALCE